MALTTQQKIERTQQQLAKLKAQQANEKRRADGRAVAKAKQCAMITFNTLRLKRPETLDWVEQQLTRDQDKRAFAEWRCLMLPAAESDRGISQDEPANATPDATSTSNYNRFMAQTLV